MNALYFIPIFAVVLVGMISKRVPPVAAKVGLIAGFVTILIGYFVPVGTDDKGAYVYLTNHIHEFHFLGIVFALLVAIMLIIAKVRPTLEEWVQEDVKAVDMTPWKHTVLVGGILLVAVLVIYAAFADFSVLSS
jgi:SSS family solute:Na+ symporter